MNRCVSIMLAASVVVGLSACADDAPDQALQAERAASLAPEYPAGTTDSTVSFATVAPTGVVIPVVALDNSFRPEQLTIRAGDEVLWQNGGRNEHNILNVESADVGFESDGSWGIQVENFQPGAVYSHVFTVPGTYRYYCTIHGNTDVGMVGTIVVEA